MAQFGFGTVSSHVELRATHPAEEQRAYSCLLHKRLLTVLLVLALITCGATTAHAQTYTAPVNLILADQQFASTVTITNPTGSLTIQRCSFASTLIIQSNSVAVTLNILIDASTITTSITIQTFNLLQSQLTISSIKTHQLIFRSNTFTTTQISIANSAIATLGATTDSSLNYAVYWYNSRAIGGSTVQYIGNSINSTVTYSGRDSYAISFDGSTIEGSQLVLSNNVLYSKSSSGTAYAIYMPAASVKLGSTLSVGYNEVYGYVMFNVANHAGPLQLRNLLWSKIDVLIYGPVNSEIVIDNCSFSRLSLASLSLSGSAQPLTVQNSRMTQLIIQYCFFNGTLVSTTNTTVTTLGATTDSSLNYAVYWYNSRAIGGSTVQYIGNSINSTVTYSGRDSYAISFDGSTIEGSQLVLSNNVLYSKSSSGTAYAIYMPAASVKLGSTLSVGYNEVYGNVMFNVANHAGPLQLRNLFWSKIDSSTGLSTVRL